MGATLKILSKTFLALILFALLSVLVFFPPPVDSQTPRLYNSSTGEMCTSYKLVLYSPNEQTTYQDSMPLIFTLNWTYDLISFLELKAEYAYSIDNTAFVNVVSNQSSSDRYTQNATIAPFLLNPSFSYLIDITNLTDGNHEIVIRSIFYFGSNILLNDTATPFGFTVQNSTKALPPSGTPNPTPTTSPTQNGSPCNSPTQQPTTEQSPTPAPTATQKVGNELTDFQLLIIGLLSTAIIIGVGVTLNIKYKKNKVNCTYCSAKRTLLFFREN